MLLRCRRAITVSLDAVHGLAGQIADGDHVDVYVGLNRTGAEPVIKLLIADMTVLRAPISAGGGVFTLKASTKQTAVLAWAMDNGKILLCNLSKGALGEDVSSLLGSLIVTKLSLAALSRQDVPESEGVVAIA